jgi:hypothetical protein
VNHHQQKKERNSPMTENTVLISISIKGFQKTLVYQRCIKLQELESTIGQVIQEVGNGLLEAGIDELDGRLNHLVPASWQNVGTERRVVLTSLGKIHYLRHIYMDKKGNRRKPVDEILGVKSYERDSLHVREMGAYAACTGTYRQAASQLSWLIKEKISHSTIQRMVWQVGNQIADGEKAERERVFGKGGQIKPGRVKAPVLYGESDGVWLHLQRESRKSTEVRVATLYSGKKQVGKKRFGLIDKCIHTSIGENTQDWQEGLLQKAHQYYDLETTQILITGGDGNAWVRNSFARFGIKQEFVLDRFHLCRAASRAIQDRTVAHEVVRELRQFGFSGVKAKLGQMIDQSTGKRKERLFDFYQYVFHHQDGLLDLEQRSLPGKYFSLGTIEGNVDKLVVQRMKGRGCCWKLAGARAMLSICQYRDEIRQHAFAYRPFSLLEKPVPKTHGNLVAGTLPQASMPIFSGPHQNKPWVIALKRYVYNC